MDIEIKKNTLETLKKAGQSPWYDNIDRRFIKEGLLARLFENGILGVTSNPTIFEKSISASEEYDESIKKLVKNGKNAVEIYDILSCEDVGHAADLLRDTYENTGHLDGYVSIEVLPEIAHDALKTVKSARGIFRKIGRPNIMIKIPGTKESPEAVRALTREGININVTLLFSRPHYETCAIAYIEGLKERVKDGKDVSNIFSVASVFISRVDAKLDKVFEERGKSELKGKIAVSNAKIIYKRFKELFNSDEFVALKKKGANPQRVLWASTSAKNPDYRDVKYVEELIGPYTINTMPPQTIEAFLDHGIVDLTIEKDVDKAKSYLATLKNLGIDINNICQKIQDEGVDAFQASFDKLTGSIKQKIR